MMARPRKQRAHQLELRETRRVTRWASAGRPLPAAWDLRRDAGPAGSSPAGRTRAAYGRAAGRFLEWCAARGLGLRAIALHVAAYIRTHPGSAPTVKQHLAAILALCDWLVVHQVLPVNPTAAVRGPKHVVTKGATPVLTPAETRALLDRIDTGTLVGLRDRALLSVMVYRLLAGECGRGAATRFGRRARRAGRPLPRGLGFYAGRPGPRGTRSAGCPTESIRWDRSRVHRRRCTR